MTTTLTDRYIHAATRWLPGKTRTEVAAELRERIGDMVAANGSTPEAERDALEELGDPLRVATDYAGREPVLISSRWFFPWLRLLLVLLAIVPPVVATIATIAAALQGESIGSVVATAVVTVLEVIMQVTFWTTVVFVILDWSGSSTDDLQPWSVDRLPAETNTGVGVGELIAGLVMFVLLAALLIWQHVASPFFDDGERIPIADPALWNWYLPLVLLTLVLEGAHLAWIHRTGWTWPAAWANAAVNLVFTVPTVVLLLEGTMVNPDLVTHLGWDPEIVDNVLRGTAVGLALLGLWEIIDGFRRAYLRHRA